MTSALTMTRHGGAHEAAAEAHASETRVLGGGGAPEACALAVRGSKRRRASGLTGAA